MVCLAVAIPMLAQQKNAADPISGTWTGDWGPNAGDRNTVTVDMKSDGKAVTGTVHSVNFQRPDVPLQKSTFDAKTGAIHMEAEVPGQRGAAPVHFVIDGKVDKGTMSGSWNHGNSKGDFKLTKK
jgi:hypothetical protein